MILNEQELLEYKNFLILNEAYIGKTPILEEIEKKIGELRKKITFRGANDTLKETLEINRLFEKQFGMEIFSLHIIPTKYFEGYTMCIGKNFDIAFETKMSEWVIADAKNGYKFKPGNGFAVVVNISTAFFLNPDISNGEILTIILHEIGHNFGDAIYNVLELENRQMMKDYYKYLSEAYILYAISIIGIPTAIKIKKMLKEYNNKYIRTVEQRKQKEGKGKLKAFFNSIRAQQKDFFTMITVLSERLAGGKNLKKWIENQKKSTGNKQLDKQKAHNLSVRRQDETFADKFVAIYGYGPEAAKALYIMEYNPQPEEAYLAKYGKEAYELSAQYDKEFLAIYDIDEHPSLSQRILLQYRTLQNELSKEDIDPKMKKVLQDQMKQIMDTLELSTTITKEMSKSEEVKTTFNLYVKNQCPYAIEKEIEENIEKAFDDLLD